MSLNALYVDFNSYFASVEQQLQPHLRGKPVAVLPVLAETTCCIAASYEAKAFGVKTGTMVRDAQAMCPEIVLVQARPSVYVEHHHQLIALVESCTHVEAVLSIDEMVCQLSGSERQEPKALALAQLIKQTIYAQYPYIKCSIGIGPNTFLSKVASNMQKPDGCTVIRSEELPQKLFRLQLRDLNGVGKQMERRLLQHGITTVEQLYAANKQQLRTAWGSVEGERMYDKLRGIEPYVVKNTRSSLGHSHVLPPAQRNLLGARAVLHKLLQKAAMRMRSYGLLTTHLSIKIKLHNHQRFVREAHVSATDNTLLLTQALEAFFDRAPRAEPVAVSVQLSGLTALAETSGDLFTDKPIAQTEKLNATLDKLNLKYGKNTIYLGGAHAALDNAPMRIAFQHVPDLTVESDH